MSTVFAENRKAKFNYQILETVEVGIVLKGNEVKSIRNREISIEESYIISGDDSLYIVGAHIRQYGPNGFVPYDPVRKRKLLLKKHEFEKLRVQVSQKGLTLVPLKLYLKKQFIKLEVALAKGKAAPDKRQSIKERESKRDLERVLKSNKG